MKKIFTLIIAATAALAASAQTQYGIYADITSGLENEEFAGCFMSVDKGDGTYGYGVKGSGVTFKYGTATKYLPDLQVTYPDLKATNSFSDGAFIFDVQKVSGTITSTWSLSYGDEVAFVSGYAPGEEKNAEGQNPADAETSTRWPETVDGVKVDYGAKDLAEISDYWGGFEIEVPAGQTLNVSKISAAIGGGNNFAWSVQVYNEAGERLYDSKTGFIQSGNSTTESKQGNHIGYSADITATEVSEPLGGTNFRSAASGLGEGYFEGLTGEAALPLTAAKIAAITTKAGWDPTSGKTPASRFQTLPEGGLKLTGKNTVRLYFGGIKNSRLFAIEHFYVEGEAVTDGISSVIAGQETCAPSYNLAGQAVGSDYKGVVIKGGKKVVQ